MPTTPSTINYYVAADGTLRDGSAGSIAQTPRIYYGTEYAVTLSFPPSTIAEGDKLQVALNRTRTFFSSASATGDAPVAAVVKHDVTAEEAAAQEVAVVLSTNTRAMIDQVNGIDHPVRGFFGVHILRGQSFVTLAVADALMMSLESGPDAISPSLPVVDYPTREEAEQIKQDTITAQGKAEEAQGKAETAQGKAEDAQEAAETAQGKAEDAQEAAETAQEAAVSAKDAAQTAQANAEKIAEGSDADVAPLGLEHSAKGWAQEAAATLANKRDILQTLVTSSSTALEVEAGKSYNWTVSAASTISMKAADKVANKETRIDIYIDLQDGGSVSGDGVTVADAVLQSGWYKLIWDGTNATLYSTKAGGAASVITIPAATTSYTLQDNKHYQQIPSAVPTYTLPTATMDGLVHEITVLVDFMHVTSCSFVDASNVPVTLQSAISPQIGEAYIFRCYWYGKWRVVPLKIRNAATASSSNGVVEVSDAVAGDALALRMTAPRSVVVNQRVDANNNIAASTNASYSSVTYDKPTRKAILSVVQESTSNGFIVPSTIVNGHTYLASCYVTTNVSNATVRVRFGSSGGAYADVNVASSAESFVFCKVVSNVDYSAFFVFPNYASALPSGSQAVIRDVQLVDLTQYFNGDSALINSITSWDDLVAYDPRFASYVEYNTGEVSGVQPTVKVTGKNLFDKNGAYEQGYYAYNNGQFYPYPATKCFSIPVKGGETYTRSTTTAWGNSITYWKDSVFISGEVLVTSNMSRPTFVVPSNANICKIAITDENFSGNFQIELGSVATAYEPYHDGGTAQAPAPLFAVGNAADEYEAVSGVTTEAVGKVNLGTLDWSRSSSGLYSAVIADSVTGTTSSSAPYLCTKLNTVASVTAQSPDWSGKIGTNSTLYVAYSGTSYVDIFKGLVNGSYLYYQRTTPTTSTSTPTQITLQAGNNTAMQTDGGRTLGELSMTYENLPAAN